jgi:hypothetical protein
LSAIAERYQAVVRQVADAADRVGRPADDVRIVAVTKTVGVAEVRAALTAGLHDFGENRVREFEGKFGLFPDARWHFIGTLQTNKVKDVVGKACLIHSVDSLHLLGVIDHKAAGIDVVQPLLLQVNVSGEQAKHGFEPHEVADVLVEAAHLPHVAVKGLMTIAPLGRAQDARPVFRELRELRDSLSVSAPNGVELGELSMGMTNDYSVAIEEGATIVRIGRAIFGM